MLFCYQNVPSHTIFNILHTCIEWCGLHVPILFDACVGIVWDAPNALKLNAQDM
jgi:hypothetical protein